MCSTLTIGVEINSNIKDKVFLEAKAVPFKETALELFMIPLLLGNLQFPSVFKEQTIFPTNLVTKNSNISTLSICLS